MIPPTPRQRLVLAGLARGYHHQEIAVDLGVSYSTVKKHVQDLRGRYNVHSAAALIRLAYEHGWLTSLTPEERPPTVLPNRQQQVLQLAAADFTQAQIARRLCVSLTTAAEHERRLRHTLGARTRPHAVALGYQHHHLTARRTAAAA